MSAPVRDEQLTAAMQCSACQRWVVFSIPPGEDPELRGDALGYCAGKPHRPVSSGDGLTSNFGADGTAAYGA